MFLTDAREKVNAALQRWAPAIDRDPGGPVGAAIVYSLEGAGKRLRPALVMAVYGELGGTADVADLAAAVEVVHTYSLVHDDLPCMDDDALRRGRPTAHRRFGVAVATEAGFRMVPLAARMLAAGMEPLGLSEPQRRTIGATLFAAAGVGGMIAGQVLDLDAGDATLELDDLAAMHRAKTGALITASAVIGGLAADASKQALQAIRIYGDELGIAFQIVDDVLDGTESSVQLGKTAGKDARQQKTTFATLLGPDRALTAAREHVARAIDHLGASGIDSPLLADIAQFVINRRS